MIFLDLLAYGAMLMFATGLLVLGVLLLRISTQRLAWNYLFGVRRAKSSIAKSELSHSNCRFVGFLLCAAGCFLVFCIVRDVAYA